MRPVSSSSTGKWGSKKCIILGCFDPCFMTLCSQLSCEGYQDQHPESGEPLLIQVLTAAEIDEIRHQNWL